jgi:hypothetical protein
MAKTRRINEVLGDKEGRTPQKKSTMTILNVERLAKWRASSKSTKKGEKVP